MRRLTAVTAFAAVAAGLAANVVGISAGATAPPDTDAAAESASERFDQFLEDEGYDVVAPVCVETDEPMTFVCYALTADGEPVVAQTSVDTDVVEWDVLFAPGSAAGEPEASEPEASEPEASRPDVSDPEVSEPTAGGADESIAPEPDALAFFDAVFSADAEQIDGAIGLTQPGSPAEAYARFQHLFVVIAAEYGNEVTAGEVSATTDGFEVCVTPANCSQVSDVEVSDGQIVSFSVDGNEIAGRLATTTEPVVAATTAVRLVVAYQTVTGGQLAAYVEVASEEGDSDDLAAALYVGADGVEQPVAPDLSLGLDTTKLKGNQTALLAFPGAEPGGELHITVTPADGSAPVDAVIPVEAMEP